MQVPLNGLTEFDSRTGTMGYKTKEKENHQMITETRKPFTAIATYGGNTKVVLNGKVVELPLCEMQLPPVDKDHAQLIFDFRDQDITQPLYDFIKEKAVAAFIHGEKIYATFNHNVTVKVVN